MKNIIRKEMTLSASILSYLFIAFGLMFFIPGYPVLCGAFFVCLGIFQSFQYAREANDIVFSALLPIAKQDVVRGKYLFVCLIELGGALLMAVAVLVRMTVLKDAPVYQNSPMLQANCFALGMAFLIFGCFNLIFVGGFFKTAYRFGKPFVGFLAVAFVLIGLAEALPHIPGLEALNADGLEPVQLQAGMLGLGIVLYMVLTALSYRRACRHFDRIDL